jgi:hypothetical protein
MTIDWQRLKKIEFSKRTSIIIIVVVASLIFGIGTFKIYRSVNPTWNEADAKQKGIQQEQAMKDWYKAHPPGGVKSPAPAAPLKK